MAHTTHVVLISWPRELTVAQKISELVGEGMTDVQEVRRALKHYVNTVLCAQNLPSPDDCLLHGTL